MLMTVDLGLGYMQVQGLARLYLYTPIKGRFTRYHAYTIAILAHEYVC
jgi:hypothetical protein